MSLGMVVGLCQRHIVLDGDPAPLPKEGAEPPPIFGAFLLRPNGWMHQDTAAFCRDILQSKLYDSTTTSAHEYAELFDGEVRRVLDIHAPLRTRRRRCGQHDIRHLSKIGTPISSYR